MTIRIPVEDPIVIPATVEKTYPDREIIGFGARKQAGGELRFIIETQASNFDTGEVNDDPKTIKHYALDDIKADAQRSPVVASALGDFRDAISLLYRETYLREKLAGMEDGPDRDAVIVKFHNVQTQLDIDPLEDPPPPFVPEVLWAKPGGNTPDLPPL